MSQTEASLESNVRLPRAVRERSERIRQMTEPQAPEPEANSMPPAPAPAIEAPGTSQEPPPAAAKPADPRESDPQYWSQRFRVTQGMLDREIRERRAAEEQMQAVINDLRDKLRTTQQSQPTAPSAIDLSAFFTPEQIEQYGKEQCETIASVSIRAAREQTQAAIQAELQPIREERAREAEHGKREKQRAFVSALAELVPDYAEIDATDGWKAWLGQEDEATGLVRQGMLDRHVMAGRADLAARLFTAYQSTIAAPLAPPVAPRGKAGPPDAPQAVQRPAQGYPSAAEIRDFHKRAATKRPGQPGYVTDKERSEFEARLQLQRSAA